MYTLLGQKIFFPPSKHSIGTPVMDFERIFDVAFFSFNLTPAHCPINVEWVVPYFISLLIVLIVINAITYWMWVVVRSAYKQIKDENTANSYPNAYPMNVVTDQKPTAPMNYQA